MTEILVEGENLVRTYRQGKMNIVALADATFKVEAGDRIALVGPNGSGKSTLLHLMGGLDTPTSGKITWHSLGKRETLRPAKIAFIFQPPNLLSALTIVENVELPLLLGKTLPSIARLAAMEALLKIQLEAVAHKLPKELSSEQVQRAALARVLAHGPKLILADEPTGQLDQCTAQRFFDVLLDTIKHIDTALVVATHHMNIAERLYNRWFMEHGILKVATHRNCI